MVLVFFSILMEESMKGIGHTIKWRGKDVYTINLGNQHMKGNGSMINFQVKEYFTINILKFYRGPMVFKVWIRSRISGLDMKVIMC